MKEEIKEITNKMIKTSQPNGVFLTAKTRNKIIYYINNSLEENERLHSIIKEVREYIEKLKNFKIKYVMFEEKELYASENDFVKELLEILDKGEI